MLHIYFGPVKNTVLSQHISWYFRTRMKDEWFNDNRIVYFLSTIQNTKYLGNKLFKSDWFDIIPADKLATGVQCAILLCKYQSLDRGFYPNFARLGGNCYDIVLDYSLEKDIYLHSTLDYLDFKRDIRFICDNDGKEYSKQSDIFDLSYRYLKDYMCRVE